jgi:hypothetical protein
MIVSSVLGVLVFGMLVARPARAGTGMFVGAAEDESRSLDPLTAKSKMDLAAIAGLGTIRMTAYWSPGESAVGGDDLVALQNSATAAQFDGVRLILSVYPRDQRTTPLTAQTRGEFASFAASIAREVPGIRDFVVGNEPNLNLFWMPQFGAGGRDLAAASYELLLAKTYDALKSVSPEIDVIGGALSPRGQDKAGALRQTHSPTAFIADLGVAYRKTHRKRPIMDAFALHPYLASSRQLPSFAHPNTTTIGIADYPKLVKLLTRAFARTAQSGATLPIIYDEFGIQTLIPARKRSLYRHLGTVAARDAITEPRQAVYYRKAIALAECQPTVAGVLIFHVADERDANAWQSGVYYADDTPKTSMDGVRLGALAAQGGTFVHCTTVKTASSFEGVVFHEPPPAPGPLQIDLTCNAACTYHAQLIDLADGQVAATADGAGTGGETTVSIPADGLSPGNYQYVLRAYTAGRPGTAVTRYSQPFTIPPTDGGAGTPTAGALFAAAPQTLLPLLPSLPTLVPIVP